jgi:uracil DNA glycosylase superfamily protein
MREVESFTPLSQGCNSAAKRRKNAALGVSRGKEYRIDKPQRGDRKAPRSHSVTLKGWMSILTVHGPNELISRLRDDLKNLDIDIADRNLEPFTRLPRMTHGFFPKGNGLYDGVRATRFPIGGTLVLGSNFGRIDSFLNPQGGLTIQDERSTSPTWRGLRRILDASGIRVEECFFTNAWPFLHPEKSNLGPVPVWLRDQKLMVPCVDFFKNTIAMMKPRLIVGLGTGPAAFLGHVWPKELAHWRARKLRNLDDLPMATIPLQKKTAVCVGITHPSMPNARHRRLPFRDFNGEVQLLIEARVKSEGINK